MSRPPTPPALDNRCVRQLVLPNPRPANRTTNLKLQVRWEGYRAQSCELEAKPSAVWKTATRRPRRIGREAAFRPPSSTHRQMYRHVPIAALATPLPRASVRRESGPKMNRLALVMIVRDEARCLERCLASARPWVDEMLVLDTGSLDATMDVARRAGARVERFAWSDDFAAARNAALAHSDAAWRLVLDADEWISGGAESLAALRHQPADFI